MSQQQPKSGQVASNWGSARKKEAVFLLLYGNFSCKDQKCGTYTSLYFNDSLLNMIERYAKAGKNFGRNVTAYGKSWSLAGLPSVIINVGKEWEAGRCQAQYRDWV